MTSLGDFYESIKREQEALERQQRANAERQEFVRKYEQRYANQRRTPGEPLVVDAEKNEDGTYTIKI